MSGAQAPENEAATLLKNARALIAAARSGAVPVVYVQHCGRAGDEFEEGREAMLLEAFSWDSAGPRPTLAEFREHPEFTKLLADWGRLGDRGVVAEEQQSKTGAAWFRLWTPELHSYGFVNAETPELGIAVASAHRSKGVGRTLLRALIEIARADGHPALSLSMSPSNYALPFYESEGFHKVGESGTSWTLLLQLGRSGSGDLVGLRPASGARG